MCRIQKKTVTLIHDILTKILKWFIQSGKRTQVHQLRANEICAIYLLFASWDETSLHEWLVTCKVLAQDFSQMVAVHRWYRPLALMGQVNLLTSCCPIWNKFCSTASQADLRFYTILTLFLRPTTNIPTMVFWLKRPMPPVRLSTVCRTSSASSLVKHLATKLK